MLSLLGCLCDAQSVYKPSNVDSQARPPFGRPLPTQAAVTTRPIFGRPLPTQAAVTARPTFGRPLPTQAAVTTRPIFGRPLPTQAAVTTRPIFGRPLPTQAAVTARPTFGRPLPTQSPVPVRPTFGRPVATQSPVPVRPTFGKPPVTQGPVTPRPTIKEPPQPKPDSVKAHCGETSVQLEVDVDLFGIGNLIQPSDITLGGCDPIGQDHSWLLFETQLHACGSTLMMTEDTLVYTFTIRYQPKAIGVTPIIRTNDAAVGVQCHYMRLHNVSSNALKSTWIPYYSTLSAEDLLVFSLRLMTNDWRMERESYVFFLGDIINIEASVIQANHVPLRVFMDTCVATLAPNMDSVPRYTFIDNQGCLMDSKLTSSRSKFQSRIKDDLLQVQLDAFRFAAETRSEIYIFCHLRATAALPESEGKACSFLPSKHGWVSASGNDQACGCCDTGCSVRKGRSLEPAAAQYSGNAFLGPIIVQKPTNDMPELSTPLKAEDHRAAGVSPEAVVVAGVVAAVGLVCIVVLVTVLRRSKPTAL
uniref:Zona pellucida sperm-binding protein 3 n=1 Tax=Anguilla japonica TaxID=7937 RepID=E5RSS7_ANGJA|nr:egg envelope protein [Anguilla japonica]